MTLSAASRDPAHLATGELPAGPGRAPLEGNRDAPARMRVLFLVMSAVAQPGTIDQLALALAPHQVLVHHDFSQRPDFRTTAPNIVFVPDPKRTGWAEFGFVEGIFHALQYALQNLSFDYVQLLSPSCLPIKPMAAFEQHVASGPPAHFDGLALAQDTDVLMSVGYRAFTQQHSLMYRLARRLPHWYYGRSAARRDEAGVWLRSGHGKQPLATLAGVLTRAMSRFFTGHQPTAKTLPLYYGSTWFGARREVVQGMVKAFSEPVLHRYFSKRCIAEEFLIPSLLMQLTQGHKGPLNHCIQVFEQAHPGWFDVENLPQLRASRAFFARKFKDDPLAPVRLRVLGELAGRPDLAERATQNSAGVASAQPPPGTAQPQLPSGPRLEPHGGPATPALPA